VDRVLLVLAVCALVAAATIVIRRRRPRRPPERIDPGDVGLSGSGVGVVGFSTPYCVPCRAWEGALAGAGLAFAKVDVSERPELARKYGVTTTPLVLAVRLPDGEVVEAYGGEPEVGEVERLRALAGGAPAPA
jgi:hypothetical protein